MLFKEPIFVYILSRIKTMLSPSQIHTLTRLSLFSLFLYSATIKWLQQIKFTLELAKSPLIPEMFIAPLAYTIPVIEIAICILLFIERTKKVGIYLSFALMLLFTLYLVALITIPTNGEIIPCACGGILGGMSYPVHIAFNIFFFTLVALVGIYTSEEKQVLVKQTA